MDYLKQIAPIIIIESNNIISLIRQFTIIDIWINIVRYQVQIPYIGARDLWNVVTLGIMGLTFILAPLYLGFLYLYNRWSNGEKFIPLSSRGYHGLIYRYYYSVSKYGWESIDSKWQLIEIFRFLDIGITLGYISLMIMLLPIGIPFLLEGILLIFIFIPHLIILAIPLIIGDRLEPEYVDSGLRFAGFIVLALGFGIESFIILSSA